MPQLPHPQRALIVTTPGGVDVLEIGSEPPGEPGPDELLVDVAAAGVNFIDVYHRTGAYSLPAPFTLGQEGAGTVVEAGSGTSFSPGDEVAWASSMGSAAKYSVVPAASAVPVPAGVDLRLAAAVMLQGMTAHYLCFTTYPVQPGDDVLVHAAAGGVGQLLTQLVKERGGRVIATVSTEAKADVARSLGAHDVLVGYDDVATRVRGLTDGRGVHVVYDGVGQATFDASLESLRKRGYLVLYGAASGAVPPLDPQRLNAGGSLFLTRPKLLDYSTDREELEWRAREVLERVGDGRLSVEIGGEYDLAEAATAYTALEGRKTTGKLLLIP